jgi:light-regulated signal transduction histidine kinase (bacteriophytochrome)
VSHDLREPVRTIMGFSDLLANGYSDKLDDKGRKHLAWIANGAQKLNQIIDELLHLSRISRQDVKRQDVDLSGIAATIAADLRRAQPDRSVAIDIKKGVMASADAPLVKVILSNLIGNAWKFTSKREHARIEFGTFEHEGKTVYYVKDNGAGFDQKFADRLFLPFHRLHSEQEFEGTGIGLATVERAVRRHGGEIWTEGKTGEGAAFFFTLI